MVELFREGKFSYRVLTPRDETLMVLSRAFCTEPLISKLAEIKPEMTTHLCDLVEFVDYFMDHCSSNGMSVIAVDTETGRVAGSFIGKDLLWRPPEGFMEKYTSDEKTLSPVVNFLSHVEEEATKKMPELGETGKAVDLWMLGVNPDYRGNKIAHYLTKAVQPLCKKAGYKYATIDATNPFTSKAAEWNNFTSVHVEKVADWPWKWKGELLDINNMEAPHGICTFWVKNLEEL